MQQIPENGCDIVLLAIGNKNAVGSDVSGLDRFDQGLRGRRLGHLAGHVNARKLLSPQDPVNMPPVRK